MQSKTTRERHPFIEATPKNFRPGNSILPKRDLSAVVRWPKCVQLQRKKAILLKKIKIPPVLFQFHTTLDKNDAINLFKLLYKYRPETSAEKKQRLIQAAEDRVANKVATPAKRNVLINGLDYVTKLVEQKRARLVVIAHDVQPIELVCWLPTLCTKMQVPYCIVKGKARLGALVNLKNTAVVALENVNSEDVNTLNNMIAQYAPMYINNADARRNWGN